MIRFRSQFLLYAVAIASITLDQVTKYLVRTQLAFGETYVPILALRDIFDITHTTNTGAAFGMFPNGGAIFTVIAIVVIVVVIFYSRSLLPDQWVIGITLGLQLGGAVGNLIDRLLFGPVTDFLHVHNFPVFNVADSSISVGVAVLALLMLFESRQARADDAEEQSEQVESVAPDSSATPEPDTSA